MKYLGILAALLILGSLADGGFRARRNACGATQATSCAGAAATAPASAPAATGCSGARREVTRTRMVRVRRAGGC